MGERVPGTNQMSEATRASNAPWLHCLSMRLANHLRKDRVAHGEQLAANQMGARSGGKRTRAALCLYRTKPHEPTIFCGQQRDPTALPCRRLTLRKILPLWRFSSDHPEAWDPTGNPSADLAHPHPTGGDHRNDWDGYHKLTQWLWVAKQRLPLGFASSVAQHLARQRC